MRISKGLFVAVALMLGAVAAPALASGDANLIVGQKSLGDTELKGAGVDGQSDMGVAVTLDFDWPVMLALDLFSSSDSHTVLPAVEGELQLWTDVETTEVNVGVRKLWGDDRKLKPYVGGGVALIKLEGIQIESGELLGVPYSDTIVDDSDSAVGLWLDGGLLYRVGRYFNVGVDVRYSDASADLRPFDLDPFKLDAGGTHYGVLLGYHW